MDAEHANSHPRGKRRLWIILLLVAAAITALWALQREPTFNGKTASYWLDKLNSPTEQETAVSAFRAMGKPGVLFLVGEARPNPPSPLRVEVAVALNRSGWRFARNFAGVLAGSPANDRAGNAFKAIIKLGPDAEAAVPAMVEQLSSYRAIPEYATTIIFPGTEAVAALEAMGDKKTNAIPDLIKFLHGDLEGDACVGADLLASIGPKAKPAIPALLEQLPFHSYAFSNAVAGALWKIDRQTNFALSVLTNELRPLRNLNNEYPLHNLRDMGPAAKPAAPLLVPLLQDTNRATRIAAADALREIDPVLYDTELDGINRHFAANLPALIQMLHGTQDDRTAALEALAVYGPDAMPALPAIIQVLQRAVASRSELDVRDAAYVIAEMGPEASAAVPALRAALPGAGWHYGPFVVCRALANIGPGASAAVPELSSLAKPLPRQMNDRDMPFFRAGAAAALARITPESKASLMPILTNLADFSVLHSDEGFPQITFTAQVALWRLGLEKEPPIRELMLPSDSWQALVAVELLGDIGPSARAALPYLERIVNSHYDIRMRRAAAIAMRKIDPQEAARLHLPGILALP